VLAAASADQQESRHGPVLALKASVKASRARPITSVTVSTASRAFCE
jgi:hypothetical protein